VTLNTSEATAVNTLALWMLPLDDDWRHPTEAEAREAMAELMDKAHKTLSAGMTSTELLDRWCLSETATEPLPPAHGPGCKAIAGTHSFRHPGEERWLCTPNCPRRKWQDAKAAAATTEVHSGTPCPKCGSQSTQKMSERSVYCSECKDTIHVPNAAKAATG
jgi:hypothetical protein